MIRWPHTYISRSIPVPSLSSKTQPLNTAPYLPPSLPAIPPLSTQTPPLRPRPHNPLHNLHRIPLHPHPSTRPSADFCTFSTRTPLAGELGSRQGSVARWGVEQARTDGVPACLEASAAGKPVYEVCGFRQVGELAWFDMRPFGIDLGFPCRLDGVVSWGE